MDKTLFKRSEETSRIVNYLREHDKNAQVPYTELSKIVGMKLSANSPKLIHARHILQRDHNAVWVCVTPGIGVKRLNDVEIAERLQPWWMRGARNKLKRAEKEIEIVDQKALDINQLARFGVDCIQRELAFNSLSRATRNRMEKVARGTSNDLPSFNIVEWAINLSQPKALQRQGK
jgi:hypothetical protein